MIGSINDEQVRGDFVFFFKQKTAYEIGTGDWNSDGVLFRSYFGKRVSKCSVEIKVIGR